MKNVVFVFSVFLLSSLAFAQDGLDDDHQIAFALPATSVLDIEGPGGDKHLTFTTQAVVEAGSANDYDLVDETLWLNYTNVKPGSGSTRKIVVQMNGDLPDGMTLTVAANGYAGNGEGEVGTPHPSAIVLDGSIASIVTNIGSVYTGNGISNGHNLIYALTFDEDQIEYLSANLNTSVIITYTIEDE
mgnify:CR=1 FL=1